MNAQHFEPRDVTIVHESIWRALGDWAADHGLDLVKGSDGDADTLPFYILSPRNTHRNS